MPSSEFDFIVVGAGASGCVLANRLTADGSTRVLLLEAGAPPANPNIAVPGAWTTLAGTDVDWAYRTEPEPALNQRRINWPRGKTYGGSSAISAMAHTRGHQLDYDAWGAAAGAGWNFAALLPWFRRSEDNARGASDMRGAGGPLRVEDTRDPNAAHLAFLGAAREAGYAADPEFDFNGSRQENGAGFHQKTRRGAKRVSVADAYLSPALSRPNLVVRPSALVHRVVIEGGRAVGVEFSVGSARQIVRARREVVIAAGVIETPKLLMLSGIGPATALSALNIPVVVDCAEVGRNLQDHPRVPVRWQATQPIAGSSVTAGLFTHSRGRAAVGSPDIHFYVGRGLAQPDSFITITAALGQPKSRGSITLQSADPSAKPLIHANYFSAPEDLDAMLEAVRIAQSLGESRAFASIRGGRILPGPDVTTAEGLRAHIRATAETMFHQVGSCRMGRDADSVVDHELRVRGVANLRVADGSIMPSVINAPTNWTCVVIGERAAELLV